MGIKEGKKKERKKEGKGERLMKREEEGKGRMGGKNERGKKGRCMGEKRKKRGELNRLRRFP